MKDLEKRLGIHILDVQITHGQFYCEVEISFYDPKTIMNYSHRIIGSYGQPVDTTLKVLESQIKHALEKLRGEHEHSR